MSTIFETLSADVRNWWWFVVKGLLLVIAGVAIFARPLEGYVGLSVLFSIVMLGAGGIAIYQLPGANALDTAKGVRKLLDSLAPAFPAGLVYQIPFDTTTFVRQSVSEVYRTLFEAGALVLDDTHRDAWLNTVSEGTRFPMSTMPGEQVDHVFAGQMGPETIHFLEACIMDRPVMVTPESARLVMETYTAADLSAERNEPVELPLSNAALSAVAEMVGGKR